MRAHFLEVRVTSFEEGWDFFRRKGVGQWRVVAIPVMGWLDLGLDHLTHQSPHGYAAENCCRDGSCLRAEADPYGVEMPAHSELVWDFAQLDVDNKLARVLIRPPARQLPFGRDR